MSIRVHHYIDVDNIPVDLTEAIANGELNAITEHATGITRIHGEELAKWLEAKKIQHTLHLHHDL